MTKEYIIDKLQTLIYNYNNGSLDPFSDEENEIVKQTIELLEASPVFICDGKACDECSKGECKHTLDVRHAVNFHDKFETGFYEEKITSSPRVINLKINHLRTINCDCCGSTIEYNVNDAKLHSSAEAGFGDDIWLKSIDCPNCKNKIVF